MQLLLKNKPPPCGGGGGAAAIHDHISSVPSLKTAASASSENPPYKDSLPTEAVSHKCVFETHPCYPCEHKVSYCPDPIDCHHHDERHHTATLVHPCTSLPVVHPQGQIQTLPSCPNLHLNPYAHRTRVPPSPVSKAPVVSMSRKHQSFTPTSKTQPPVAPAASKTIAIDHPDSESSTPGHSSSATAVPSSHAPTQAAITGAAAYHPDIVAGCCPDPLHHRYNYHHHHHHHHHHAPIVPPIEVYGRSGASGGSGSSIRKPTLESAEAIDPRFTPTCPCGGRLLRAKSLERICKVTGATLSSDEGDGAGTAGAWKGTKTKSHKEEGSRRKKESKGRMRRLVEFTHLSAIFRPRKVRSAF